MDGIGGIDAGGVYSELVLDTSKFDSGIAHAGTKLNSIEDRLNKTGQTMTNVGKKMTMAITLPIAGVAAAALNVGKNFEEGMSKVSALSGATGDDLQKLEDVARELAASTKYSATEAADALGYMALAGFDVDQMAAALPSVLSLATAANMDLAAASDIVTDTMGAFGIAAEDSAMAADIFAQAQAKSNTNVEQLGEAMKYAGPAANAANQDLAETSTILGVLADSGLKGSIAGNTLTAMFRDMKKASEDGAIGIGETQIALYNANGEFRDMGDIIAEVNVATKDMTTEQRDAAMGAVFQEQSIKGMNIMLETGTERYNELESSIRGSNGAAEEMAGVMGDNLQGKIAILKSTLEEAGLQIAEVLLPVVQDAVEKFTEWVSWFSNLDEGTQKTIIKMAGFAAALGPVLLVGGKTITLFTKFGGLLKLFPGVAGAATTAVSGTASGFTLAGGAAKAGALLFNPWVLGAAAVVAGGVLLAKHLREDSIPAMEEWSEKISETTQTSMDSFLEMEQNATANLNTMAWTGTKVTAEMAEGVVGNTDQMANDVIAILEKEKEEHLRVFSEKMAENKDLTEEKFNELYDLEALKYDEQIAQTQEKKDKVREIYELAMEENRAITEEEKDEILILMGELKDETITLVSESKIEQEAIYEDLKTNAGRMSAEMLLEIVNNSKSQKEETIAYAEAEYSERMRYAEKLKEEGTEESIAMANSIIAEAERQKATSIQEAEEMHEKVLGEVKAQGGDVVKQLDLDNGVIKSKWQELSDWFDKNPIIRKIKEVAEETRGTSNYDVSAYISKPERNASGTDFFSGGRTWVGEAGPEIVDLPRGSSIYSNEKSMEMSATKMEHSGTITVKGVNDRNQTVAVVDMVMDQLGREVRL